jgi:hypothetical protein
LNGAGLYADGGDGANGLAIIITHFA